MATQPDIVGRTFDFALRVIKLCQTLDQKSGVARILARQVLRSGTSIGANVEEAQAAQSQADFVNKYNIALKEARETCYWLRLLDAGSIIPQKRLGPLIDEAGQITRILAKIMVNTINKKKKAN